MIAFLSFLISLPLLASAGPTVAIECHRENSKIFMNYALDYPRLGVMELERAISTSLGFLPAGKYEVIGFVDGESHGVELPARDVVGHFTFPAYVRRGYSLRVAVDRRDGRGAISLSAEHSSGSYFYFYREPLECRFFSGADSAL